MEMANIWNEDPEGSDGEGGGREYQEGKHM